MLTKRIIPCLDIKNGRTVKGVNFVNLQDAGDPVELAAFYSENGADELTFLDISATIENRSIFTELLKQISERISIPFTVGGGIRTVSDVARLLSCGADKISINSEAVKTPTLITALAKEFGSQCVVCAIDSKDGKVFVSGGRVDTGIDVFSWAKRVVDLGAGEILLTGIASDGTKAGFDKDLTQKICESVSVPVIASGGAGTKEHFLDLFKNTWATGALAASVFHYKQLSIYEIKNYLKENGIPVRL